MAVLTPGDIRFAADGMLRSLATWLRLLGYDCRDDRAGAGRALLERAAAENRVFLTRNAHLAERLPHALLGRARIVLVAAARLPDQVREVIDRFQLDSRGHVFTRCLDCNEPLHACPPAAAAGRVPPEVTGRAGQFWECPACAKVYWHGSHVRNSLARLAEWLES